jgi:hypothetical protein
LPHFTGPRSGSWSAGAALLARELGGGLDPEAVSQLPRFHSLASVTLDGEISRPFRLAGVPLEELFPDACHPEHLGLLEAALDRNTWRVPVAQTLERLDRHPQEIASHLRGRRRRPPRPGGGRQTVDLGGRP